MDQRSFLRDPQDNPSPTALTLCPLEGLTVLAVGFFFFLLHSFPPPVCNTQTRARAHKHSVHTKDKCSYADELSGSGLTQTQAITMAAVDDVKVF